MRRFICSFFTSALMVFFSGCEKNTAFSPEHQIANAKEVAFSTADETRYLISEVDVLREASISTIRYGGSRSVLADTGAVSLRSWAEFDVRLSKTEVPPSKAISLINDRLNGQPFNGEISVEPHSQDEDWVLVKIEIRLDDQL